MKVRDIEIILQRWREAFPNVHPRIISDNGPQFIANDFLVTARILLVGTGASSVTPRVRRLFSSLKSTTFGYISTSPRLNQPP